MYIPIETVINILLAILSGTLVIQLAYYLILFRKLAFYKEKPVADPGKKGMPVSVIICARNEADNLKKYLPLVLEQQYHQYEVVVVNDCSWDETAEFLEQMEYKYNHLKVVTVREQAKFRHGKKLALTLGIKAAQYDHLLLTDADCKPSGNQWILEMESGFASPGADFVIGYGAYQRKWGILNRLIRYDTFYGAMQYFSFALAGMPYMGVGRNLAYRKELFFRNKGFGIYNHFLSGDDDLFVNMLANKSNTEIQIHPQSFTLSEPKTTYGEWFTQKSRHISTGRFYKGKHKFGLGLLWLSHFLFYVSLGILLLMNFDWRIPVAIYSVRLLVQMFIMGKGMKRLKEFDLLPLIIFFDFFVLIFYSILAVNNLFINKHKWK